MTLFPVARRAATLVLVTFGIATTTNPKTTVEGRMGDSSSESKVKKEDYYHPTPCPPQTDVDFEIGYQSCTVGSQLTVNRYDMFNGINGNDLIPSGPDILDQDYDGLGAVDTSYAGLMRGTGVLTDGVIPVDPTLCIDDLTCQPYVAWNVSDMEPYIGTTQRVPFTFFFYGFKRIDFITVSYFTAAGDSLTTNFCAPSALILDGYKRYDLTTPTNIESTTPGVRNLRFRVALGKPYYGVTLNMDLEQTRGGECDFIYVTEVEFNECGYECSPP